MAETCVRIDHHIAVVPHLVVALAARTQQLYLLVHPQYLLVHRPRVLVLLVPLLLLSALVSSPLSAPQRVWLLLLLLLLLLLVTLILPLVPLLTFAVFPHPMGYAEREGLNEVNEGPRGVHSAHQESGLLSWPLQGVRLLPWVASLLVPCVHECTC